MGFMIFLSSFEKCQDMHYITHVWLTASVVDPPLVAMLPWLRCSLICDVTDLSVCLVIPWKPSQSEYYIGTLYAGHVSGNAINPDTTSYPELTFILYFSVYLTCIICVMGWGWRMQLHQNTGYISPQYSL